MMRSLIFRKLSALWRIRGAAAHPSGEELFAHRSGQGGERRSRELRAHLLACSECRAALDSLDEVFDLFRQSYLNERPVAVAEDGVESLRQAIRAYHGGGEQRHLSTSRAAPFAQTRLGQAFRLELEVYLGRRATDEVLGKIAHERPKPHEVLTVIDPLLSGLLGKSVMAAIATKLLHLSWKESGLSPELSLPGAG